MESLFDPITDNLHISLHNVVNIQADCQRAVMHRERLLVAGVLRTRFLAQKSQAKESIATQ